jgi:hypothetical protein
MSGPVDRPGARIVFRDDKDGCCRFSMRTIAASLDDAWWRLTVPWRDTFWSAYAPVAVVGSHITYARYRSRGHRTNLST